MQPEDNRQTNQNQPIELLEPPDLYPPPKTELTTNDDKTTENQGKRFNLPDYEPTETEYSVVVSYKESSTQKPNSTKIDHQNEENTTNPNVTLAIDVVLPIVTPNTLNICSLSKKQQKLLGFSCFCMSILGIGLTLFFTLKPWK